MNKSMRLLPAALLCFTASAPAFAEPSQTDAAVMSVAMFPARVLGVAAGAVVGVPVATVRAAAESTVDAQARLSSSLPDEGSPANQFYSGLLAGPVGLTCGVLSGPIYGIANACKGFDHPFSTDSFSLQTEDLTRD